MKKYFLFLVILISISAVIAIDSHIPDTVYSDDFADGVVNETIWGFGNGSNSLAVEYAGYYELMTDAPALEYSYLVNNKNFDNNTNYQINFSITANRSTPNPDLKLSFLVCNHSDISTSGGFNVRDKLWDDNKGCLKFFRNEYENLSLTNLRLDLRKGNATIYNEDGSINASANATRFDNIYIVFGGASYDTASNNLNITIMNFTVYEEFVIYNETEIRFNETTYETSRERLELNLTYNSTYWTSSSAVLNYNGTDYASTKTGSGGVVVFSNVIDVFQGQGNKSFYWEIELTNSSGTYAYNTTLNNQTVGGITFDICNSTSTNTYVNYTIKDEGNLTVLETKIPTSTFYYWLGDGSINKTLSYTETGFNKSYGFCFSPPDKTVNLQYSIQYAAENYPQRTFQETTSFSNATTNKTLYLVSDSDGIYVTFQVINQADQPIEDVFVTATRDDTSSLVASGYTGGDGAVTFWLNPDYSHTLVFTHDDYNTYTTTITPTQSTYTITLGGGAGDNEYDFLRGINYAILPSGQTLINNTHYIFNFTISSSYWEIDSFGFTITNASGFEFNSTSSSSNGGIVSVGLNTDNQSQLTMNYYWEIDGNYTNASRSWSVYNPSGSSWSILNFLTDLSNYADDGMFGIDDFSMAILIFLFIFVTTGLMSYKFGINSAAAIYTFIFGIVLLLDVGVSLIPDINGYPLATILTGLVLLGLLIRGGTQ